MDKKNKEKLIIDLFGLFRDKKLEINSAKRILAKKYKIGFLKNTELLKIYHNLIENKILPKDKNFQQFLITKPIRSLSGIINISVLTKPYPCPGKCIYCPKEKGLPQSYLRGEPAVQRAILSRFSPALQIKNRLKSLEKTGHPTDKIELRIIGGTWSYYPEEYKFWFIKECFRAVNSSLQNNSPANSCFDKILKELLIEQRKNEHSKRKIVGITIETRPDYINEKEIKEMRILGITRVEIGVQSVYDDILDLNKRGHSVKETIKATRLLKKNGFKVLYQMMLNLPGSNKKTDEKMFSELFSNQDFMPDLLKIYPLALVKNAPIYKLYLSGKYKPYNKKELISLLIRIKQKVPYWCRIQRIIRDIPSEKIIEGGAKISNLREIVQGEMKKRGLFCRCIRCREIGEGKNKKDIFLFREEYFASGGKEIFLSIETKDRKKLYGILRLRIDNNDDNKFFRALKGSAIIREIHIYGKTTPTGQKGINIQHRGLGKKLIKEAEKTAEENGFKKITVIAGIGTRNYYRKLSYRLKETYMVKRLGK